MRERGVIGRPAVSVRPGSAGLADGIADVWRDRDPPAEIRDREMRPVDGAEGRPYYREERGLARAEIARAVA
jgi:hypothetical protein